MEGSWGTGLASRQKRSWICSQGRVDGIGSSLQGREHPDDRRERPLWQRHEGKWKLCRTGKAESARAQGPRTSASPAAPEGKGELDSWLDENPERPPSGGMTSSPGTCGYTGDRIFMTAIRGRTTCRTASPPTQNYRAQHVSGNIAAKPEVERSASSAATAQGQRRHGSLRRPTPPEATAPHL